MRPAGPNCTPSSKALNPTAIKKDKREMMPKNTTAPTFSSLKNLTQPRDPNKKLLCKRRTPQKCLRSTNPTPVYAFGVAPNFSIRISPSTGTMSSTAAGCLFLYTSPNSAPSPILPPR